jgi:hypothetical protein
MARIETDPNYSSPTFSRATAGTDLFKKEDVQSLASAVSTHDHSSGKGVALAAGAIASGLITSGMIANGTIVAADIASGTITANEIADGTITAQKIATGTITSTQINDGTIQTVDLSPSVGNFGVWTSFTPTLTQGVTVTITNVQCGYVIIGKLALVRMRFVATSAGTAASAIAVQSLPTAIAPLITSVTIADVGGGTIYDVSPITAYAVRAQATNATNLLFYSNLGTDNLGRNPSLTLANGDIFSLSLSYEIA